MNTKITPKHGSSGSFPVVAIGAAAGGAEAMKELLHYLPVSTGMAYLYIQASRSKEESDLAEILRSETPMPLIEAADGIELAPNQLYLLSADEELALLDGKFKRTPRRAASIDTHLPINQLFVSIAENYKDIAIGILLSGADTDGGTGLRAIKLAGGLTFVQDGSAKFQTMPKTAYVEGAADLQLSLKDIAEELNRLSNQKELYHSALQELSEETISNRDENLLAILHILHRSTGVDFNLYKMNTIKRRILRRMMLYKLESLQDYTRYLRQNAQEAFALYQDLLINVTTFFRDPEGMEFLRKNILHKIISEKGPDDPIRIWIAACATGQEAYSLAILLLEELGDKAATTPIQIFATDLSESAINKARLGVYTKDEVAGIAPKRLSRFFTKVDGHYRIIKSIRDLCIFATHNIAKEPPFSRLDIISCCNLLIYLDTQLQKRLLMTFHYSLNNNNGYLMLGKSETIGNYTNLFTQVDKKYKIFAKKKETSARAVFEMNFRLPKHDGPSSVNKSLGFKAKPEELDMEKVVDQALLQHFTPASVLVNGDLDILQFRGSTGLFLEPSPGKASLNLQKMARQGLSFELRNIVHKAQKANEPEKKEGLEITRDGKTHRVSIEAIPLKTDTEEKYFLVVFEEMAPPGVTSGAGASNDQRVKQLETELAGVREDMRSIVESYEAANEELQSANEEIVSSNEELQSINEELETSKEEIESSNEELLTINQELQLRNEQLTEAEEYSEAVFSTIRESLIILDKDLRVKSINDTFTKTFHIRQEEAIGKLIYEIGNRQWNIVRLRELLHEVTTNDTNMQDYEIQQNFSGIGEKFLLLNTCKILQKTYGQELILLAIEDITEHKQAQRIIAEREAWFRNMADNAPAMIWLTGTDKLCAFVNRSFLEFRGQDLDQAIGKPWFEGADPEDMERCAKVYDESFTQRKPFDILYRSQHKNGGFCKVLCKAKPNYDHTDVFTGFIGTCVDIPEEGDSVGQV